MTANKALVGGLVAALTVLVTEGTEVLHPVLVLLLSALATGLAVYLVPNQPRR